VGWLLLERVAIFDWIFRGFERVNGLKKGGNERSFAGSDLDEDVVHIEKKDDRFASWE